MMSVNVDIMVLLSKCNITESLMNSIRNHGAPCSYNSEMIFLCYLFARKFAPSALDPLLTMAARVMQY
jgi:hypothetical protein